VKRGALIGAVAVAVAIAAFLPWKWVVGIGLISVVALPLVARRFMALAARRILEPRGGVLRGAAAEVHSLTRITRERVIRAFADPKDAVELLSQADAADLRKHCLVDVTVTPAPTNTGTWDPSKLACIREGLNPETAPPNADPVVFVAVVLGVEVANSKGAFEPFGGGRLSGPQRLRLTLAHITPPPLAAFHYDFIVFGVVDLTQAEHRSVPASLHAKAQVFRVDESHVETADRRGRKQREAATTPEQAAPASPAPPPRARALASPPAARESDRRLPCEVILDVYSKRYEVFSAPPVEGLDVAQFRPIRRVREPSKFGPNTIADVVTDLPATAEHALAAQVMTRVRVSLEHPANLQYLVAALTTAESLARETDGVILDVHAGRLMTPDEVRRQLKAPAFEVERHVNVRERRLASGLTLTTAGLAKFGRDELGVRGVPPDSMVVARHALLTLADYLTQGQIIQPAEAVQFGGILLVAREEFTDDRRTIFLDDVEGVGCRRWIRTVMQTAGAA
jgi:hypothetical protein